MSELQIKLEEIKRQKDTYIIPGNLKKNVTVFGVTGTYEGSSGSGDVKLFDTVEHMQQDENPQEGDLAVVYREEIQPIDENSEFDSCTFPNTVVLDSAFSGNINGSFIAVDSSSGYFDGNMDMSSSRFRFDGFGDTMVRITYTSSDGITYTRTDGGEELQEFGTTIQWDNGRGSFNSVIGNFMKIGGNYFDGMYEYTLNNADNTKVRFVPTSNCEIDISNRKIIADTTSNYIDVDKDILIEILNNFAIEKSVGGVTINDVLNRTFLYLRSDNNIGIIYNVVGSGDHDFVSVLFNTDNSIKGICCNTLPIVSMDYSTATIEEYLVNINNKTYEKVNTSSNRSTINIDGGSRYLYYMPIENISVNSILIEAGSWDEHGIFDLKAIYSCSIQTTDTIGYENLNVTYKLDRLYNDYTIAKSQLNLTGSNELLPNKIAYGKNGIITGNESIYNNLDYEIVWINNNILTANECVAINNTSRDIYYKRDLYQNDTTHGIRYNFNQLGDNYIRLVESDSSKYFPLTNTVNLSETHKIGVYVGSNLGGGNHIKVYDITNGTYSLTAEISQTQLAVHNKFVFYNASTNKVYILCVNSWNNLFMMYEYNISNQSIALKWSTTITEQIPYLNCVYCSVTNSIYVNSSSTTVGFFKLDGSTGTRTDILQDTSGYCSAQIHSNRYTAVAVNNKAKLYNMQTNTWTNIEITYPSSFVMFDIDSTTTCIIVTGSPNKEIYLIGNDSISTTKHLNFTYTDPNTDPSLILNGYHFTTISVNPFTYDEFMFLDGLIIDLNTLIFYFIPDYVLYNASYILSFDLKNISYISQQNKIILSYINIVTDGSYLGLKCNKGYFGITNTEKQLISN